MSVFALFLEFELSSVGYGYETREAFGYYSVELVYYVTWDPWFAGRAFVLEDYKDSIFDRLDDLFNTFGCGDFGFLTFFFIFRYESREYEIPSDESLSYEELSFCMNLEFMWWNNHEKT